MVRPIPDSTDAPNKRVFVSTAGISIILNSSAVLRNAIIPKGLPIISPSMIPNEACDMSPDKDPDVIVIPVFANANNGMITNAESPCKLYSSLLIGLYADSEACIILLKIVFCSFVGISESGLFFAIAEFRHKYAHRLLKSDHGYSWLTWDKECQYNPC